MQTFLRGAPVSLVQQFWTVDPVTQVATPADPTGVVFTVLDPDNVETTYTLGTDANVTNPSVGTFVCALAPPLPIGIYKWRCDGSGVVVASFEDTFTIIESGVLDPASPTVATPGPCSSWINGDDVASCGPDLGVGSDTWMLDDVAYQASHILYELSGRIYPGVCERTVRPCRTSCSCWLTGPISYGMGPWYWTTVPWGFGGGAAWTNETGDKFGCDPMSKVKLAGYPVRAILTVKIDGTVMPEFDPVTSARNWRLDKRRELIRMDTPGSPSTPNYWPSCFPAGTLVLTDSGLKPIEQIAVGERVLTHRNRWRRVLASGKTRDAATVRVVGRGGMLRCTANHPILASEVIRRRASGTHIRKTGESDWIEARDLGGRAWASPITVEPLPIPLPLGWSHDDLPENFWWLVGRWVGDGWTDDAGRVTICCGDHERSILTPELRATRWLWRESGGGGGAMRWRYKDDQLCEWLRYHFGTAAANKRIPGWLFGADDDVRREFLAGYESADGYVGQSRGYYYTSIHTISRELALGTRLLANTLNRAAVVYAGQANKPVDHPTYRVNWPSLSPNEPYCQAWSDDNHLWGRISRVIEDAEVMPVYDLQVEEDHSFVAEGVVVHNCQNMSLDDDQPGTFSIEYTWGADVPALGLSAAAQLARELWLACSGSECKLPTRVTRVVRQGITYEKIVPTADLLRSGTTGLQLVDAFLATVNPAKIGRRSALYSPDIQAFGRRVGQ